MDRRPIWAVGISFLFILAAGTPLLAQESKEKAPFYIYVSQWAVPRAQWGDMAKLDESDTALQDKLVADGTIKEYGTYENLVHTEGMPTHGSWFAANSQEDILKTLKAFMSSGGTMSPVLAASKHWDHLLVSRMYNTKSGTYDNAYLAGSSWDVKPGQSEAFDNLVKTRVVPVFEKLLKEGTIVAYSVDYQAYSNENPNRVNIVSITPDAAGRDKVSKAFQGQFGEDPEIGPAMGSLTVDGSRNNFLLLVKHLVIK